MVCRGPESTPVVLKPINLFVEDKVKVSVPETSSDPGLLTPISTLDPSYRVSYKYLIPTESALYVIESKSDELVSID